MIGLIPKRLRWMAIGAGVSFLGRRTAERSVDRATEKLEEQLPESLVKVAQALPADVVRSAGAVVAATGAAKKSAVAARTAAEATGTAVSVGRTATGAVKAAGANLKRQQAALGDRVLAAADDLKVQTELERRELKAEYLRHTEGDEPATDALLDLRSGTARSRPPVPETPDPVPTGRRRHRRALPSAPVNRVQRTYRRATKPWDR